MDRREFLKKSTKFIFTGAIFVPATGILRPEFAEPFWPYQTIDSVRSTSWADWDEIDQRGWNDSSVHICRLNTIGAGSNENSKGILSGADLVYTQGGNLAGATGDPLRRTFDGGDDRLVGTDIVPHLVRDSATGWCLAFKINVAAAADSRYILRWLNNGVDDSNSVWVYINDTDNLVVAVRNGAGALILNWTSAAITESSDLWIVVEDDLTNTRAGFTHTAKPTNWTTDFDDSTSVGTIVWNGGNELDWVGHINCGLFGRNDGTLALEGDAFYFLLATKPLLTT